MAKYLYVIFLMFAALLAVSVAQAQSPAEVEGATTVDVATAKVLFDRGVQFVDVRSSNSYDGGHVPRAANLSTALTESELAEVAGKDQEVVIYCGGSNCHRSSSVCKRAVSWGWKKVYYFRDGYPGWEAAGHPSEY